MKGNYSAGFMSWQPPSASQRHVRTCPPLSLPMLAMKLTGYRGRIKEKYIKKYYSGDFNKSGLNQVFKEILSVD